MPQRREATKADVDSFDRAGKLRVPKEEAILALNSGNLEYEESLFSDPGDDYTALLIDNRQIGFWSGY
jgi:hypothetical protein